MSLIGFGLAVMLVSLMGGCGSWHESRCLLRIHTFSLAVLLVVVLGSSLYLYLTEGAVVREWTKDDTNWALVQDKVYNISKEQFYSLVEGYKVCVRVIIRVSEVVSPMWCGDQGRAWVLTAITTLSSLCRRSSCSHCLDCSFSCSASTCSWHAFCRSPSLAAMPLRRILRWSR